MTDRELVLVVACGTDEPHETRTTVPAPSDRTSWLRAAERVEDAICRCGRNHHARFSDDPPCTGPQPIVVHRTVRPIPGAA